MQEIGVDILIDQFIDAVLKRNEYPIKATANVLMSLDSDTIYVFLDLSNNDSPKLREVAAKALGIFGDGSVLPTLVGLLKDSSCYVREAAVISLGKIGDNSVILNLINALNDSNTFVREKAAIVLGWFENPEAVPFLVKSLNDEDDKVVIAAINSLRQIASSLAVEPLLALLSNRENDVRIAATKALEKIGLSFVLQPFYDAIENIDEPFEGLINQAINNSRIPILIDQIIELLKDENLEVREAAAMAIKGLGFSRGIEHLNTLPKDFNLTNSQPLKVPVKQNKHKNKNDKNINSKASLLYYGFYT